MLPPLKSGSFGVRTEVSFGLFGGILLASGLLECFGLFGGILVESESF